MNQRASGRRRFLLRWVQAGVVPIGVALAVASVGMARAAYIVDPSGGVAPPAAAGGDGTVEVDKAMACYQRGEIAQCLDFLRLARRANAEVLPAEVILAELYFRDNQVAQARAALEQAAAADPRCPQTYLLIAGLALAEGRATEAEVLFEKAHTLAATAGYSEAARKRFEADACAGLATIAERRGDWAAAAARLSAWITFRPNDGQVRWRLVRARFHLGKRDKLQEELQQARKDDPTLDPPALMIARLYTETNELKKAGEWVEYATQTAPRDPAAQLGAALWYLEHDQPERAPVHAEVAAKLDPASAPIKEARGLIAWHLRNYPEAERIFQELVVESPGNAAASALWALALAEQPSESKHHRALQLAESLARIDPNSGAALTTLGWVYHRNGRPADAERALRAALASGSVSSEAPYFLARVLAERGREAEVGPLLKLSLGAPGRFAFRSEAKEWLAKVTK